MILAAQRRSFLPLFIQLLISPFLSIFCLLLLTHALPFEEGTKFRLVAVENAMIVAAPFGVPAAL